MSRRSCLSIPHELQQIRAQRIYEQRGTGSPEGDWEQAAKELRDRWWIVRTWQLKKAIFEFIRKLARSFVALIGVIWKILTFPFWLPFKLNKMFANTDTRPFALDVVKTIATFAAAIGLFITYQNASLDRQLAQERLVTDRFARAVEQIGNDKEEVVIGGIYSLERIAQDSPKDQWTIMEVLTAFVRNNSPIPPEIQKLEDGSEEKLKALEKLDPVNIQTRAALTVIGRRDPGQDYTSYEAPVGNIGRLDLSNSNFNGANFNGANFNDVNFNGTNFNGAYVVDVNLSHVYHREVYPFFDSNDADNYFIDGNFNDANFNRADLSHTNFNHSKFNDGNFNDAIFNRADLSNADFSNADFSNANLRNADLSNADLRNANLRNADLRNAENLNNQQIKSACFWERAIYIGAAWNVRTREWIAVDEKANQKRIEEIRQDKASDPENPPDCNKFIP